MLKTKRIKLRTLRFPDAEVIENFAKDKRITKYTFVVPPPFTKKKVASFIRKLKEEEKKKLAYPFVIEFLENEKLIGMIELLKINKKNKSAEIGFWLAKNYQGKGLAKESLDLILKFAFKELMLERIEARVLSKNKPAQKLLELSGFKLEGRLKKKTYFKNQWFDDLIYAILKKDFFQ